MSKKLLVPSSVEGLIPNEIIEAKIFILRGKKVMLDYHLAELYKVPTKRLNEQVRRNIERFPADFMFQLNKTELAGLRSQIATLKQGQHRKYLPYAFTELGVAMLSSVLNSQTAIQINIEIMRTFSKLRQILATHKDLQNKINEIIRVHGGKLKDLDKQVQAIFEIINQLLQPPAEKDKKKYGFLADRK